MQKSNIIAAKFGGTSVRDAKHIIHLRDNIIQTNSDRRAIVVSAPAGVTNKLIEWVTWFENRNKAKASQEHILQEIQDDFQRMVETLQVSIKIDIAGMFADIRAKCENLLRTRSGRELHDFAVSRGEWVNAQIVAAALGFEFVDAVEFITIDKYGHCNMRATATRAERIGLAERARDGIVVGGFYGSVAGWINRPRLFSRGGSDITGAILAVLVSADEYENWTDVEGVLAADPRIVKDPQKIDTMTYRELRELAFMGAKMFHEDAVAFVRNASIPIHLRCTTAPFTRGTRIQKERPVYSHRVTGIAGKNGFSIVTVEKYGMNDQPGIQGRIERIFTAAGMGVNTTSSIDSVTVIVETEKFNPLRAHILDQLRKFHFDDVRVQDDISLICTVGERMRSSVGVSATVSGALAEAGVNIVLELQGGSEINIIRGVKQVDAENAIKSIYRAFFEKKGEVR